MCFVYLVSNQEYPTPRNFRILLKYLQVHPIVVSLKLEITAEEKGIHRKSLDYFKPTTKQTVEFGQVVVENPAQRMHLGNTITKMQMHFRELSRNRCPFLLHRMV